MSLIDLYIANAPPERQQYIANIRNILRETLVPLGYEECMSYGMIGYVVPFPLYPAGYHCDTSLPLPFVALANQKHGIHLYHMGIYADPILLQWWEDAYNRENIGKLDMGKSCIRFKNTEKIPYPLIRELMTRMPATVWVSLYEKSLKK
jgi:Domain of unknown function (DU1801)